MSARRAHIAGQLAAVALAFGVGIFVGQQFCVEPPQAPPERECPDEPQIVEHCPPDEPVIEELAVDESEASSPSPAERDVAPTGERLPDAAPPPTPRERQRLLAWARAQSSTLQGCPRDMGHTYRLAISLDIDDSGTVDAITIDSNDNLPPEFRSCLRTRIGNWILPEDLPPPERPLFFRLTL